MPASSAEPDTEHLPNYYELTQQEQSRKDTIQLGTPKSKYYLAFIVICYAAFSLSSWVILCHIGRGSVWTKDWRPSDIIRPWRDPANNPQQLRAATILAAISGVLTLPTAASVYSYAAASFAQYRTKGPKLSIRQTLALANQEWMSPLMLLIIIVPTLNRQYGSHFFWVGCLLTILGLAIWPVQQGFLEPLSTTKTRSDTLDIGAIDIPQLFHYQGYKNLGVVRLRKAMDSFSKTDCNPHLWHGTQNDNWCAGSQTNANFYTGPSFSDFFQDDEWNDGTVFMAQMPAGFNTGFERAWIPRFNTSVDYEQIDQTSAPSGCFTNDSDADLIKYQYDWEESDADEDAHYWRVQTCISSEALQSPLKNETRDRQDFEEVFYLNIAGETSSQRLTPGTWKVSAQTSVGYFELPNYHNNGTAGPLLDKFTLPDTTVTESGAYPDPDGSDWVAINSTAQTLEEVQNRGPLATIYTALFGNNSFLDTWTNPSIADEIYDSQAIMLCEDVPPMGSMIATFDDYSTWGPTNLCQPSVNKGDAEMVVSIWLGNFAQVDTMRAVLRMAAFMANEITLLNPTAYDLYPGYEIKIDMGVT